MAFNFNRSSNTNTRTAAAPQQEQGQQTGTYERAAGYINLSLPMEDGSYAPLGKRGQGLYLSDLLSAELVAYLDGLSQEEANQWIQDNLRITYWSATRDSKPTRKIKFG